LKYSFATIVVLAICPMFCVGAELAVQVISGTADGGAVTDDEVIVQIFEHGQLLHTLNGKADAEGKAVFENVPEGEHLTAVARARHQDMMFGGQPVSLRPTEDEHVASVQVFDVSTDKSKLLVETHHLILKALPGALEVTEYMQLRNSCDKAISSSERDDQNRTIVLDVKLPNGFKNLRSFSYFEDNALIITEEGFYDIMAVPPGEQHITFSYTLNVTSEVMDFAKAISLPTSEFVLFAELGAANIQGLDRTTEQATRSSGEAMQYYELDNLAPDEEIAFQLMGMDTGSSGLLTWIILGSVLGAVTILSILRLRREKETDPKTP